MEGVALMRRGRDRSRDGAASAAAGMAADPDRSRARRWPAGLLGAVALIALVDGMIARIPFDAGPRSRLDSSWHATIRCAGGPAASAEILCFGDSLMKLGIVPRILESRLGRSAFNLSVVGGQPPTTYGLLRRVLDRGRVPRAAIVNFSPLLLGMDPRGTLDWWAGSIGTTERIELAFRASEPGFAVSLLLRGMLGSLSSRDACRSVSGLAAFDPMGEEGRLSDDEHRALLRNWAINRGAQLAPRTYVPIRGSLPHPYEGPGWRWRPNPVHAYFVERFLATARDRGIPVYWVIPPAEAGWLERNEGVGTVGAYRDYVRGLVDRFPTLTVFDLQRAGWDRGLFRDPIHLNRDGAVRLSLAVAEAIARHEAGPALAGRWITPDDAGSATRRPPAEPLEDLDQSRLAVRRGEDVPITMEGPSR